MDHLENIMIELGFVLLHFLLFVFNYRVMNKKIMQPAVLFSLLWFLIISLHFIFRFTILNELFPLHTETLVIFFMGALCFSLGSYIVAGWQQKITSSPYGDSLIMENQPVIISLHLRLILLAIIIIGLPFYIQAAYRVFIASNIENFFVGLRTELSYGTEDIGITKYFVSLSFVVFAINLIAYFKEKNKVNTYILIGTLVITIVYAIFTTGRTFFFLLISIYLGISYLYNLRFSLKKISWILVIFLIIFSLMGIFYGKGGDTEDTTRDNITAATQTTGIYLVSSFNAFDWELHHNFTVNNSGNNTLRFFQKIGESLNLIQNAKYDDIVKEFVFVPYPTNIYTFYSPYIKDFGKLYSWIMISIFGFLHTFLHNKAVNSGKVRDTIYYSFMLFPLLMSFFQDEYLSLFSTWIQVIFYTEAFLLANKLFISKKW